MNSRLPSVAIVALLLSPPSVGCGNEDSPSGSAPQQTGGAAGEGGTAGLAGADAAAGSGGSGGSGGQPGPGQWIPVPLRTAEQKAQGRAGGEAGQLTFTLAISSDDPNLLALGIDTAGVYVSEDGGRTWEIRRNGIQSNGVQSVAFDPANPRVLWAAGLRSKAGTVRTLPPEPDTFTPESDGIYRSDDLGVSWTRLRPAVFLRGQSQNQYFAFDPASATPDGSQVVYAATHDSGLLRSPDGGQSWSDVGPGNAIYNAIVRHPLAGDLWLAADEGLWLSTSEAATWTELGVPAVPVLGLTLHPTDTSRTFVALGTAGVWESIDKGVTWHQLTNGLPDSAWTRLAISDADPSVMYVDPNLVGGFVPNFTHDSGVTWQRPTDREERFFGGSHWFSQGLVTHPTERLVAYDVSPLRMTSDGGLTWSILGDGLSGARRGGGVRSAIAFRPDNADKMMFFHTDHGATLTEDDGDTWVHRMAPRQFGAGTQPGGAYDPTPGSRRVVSAVGGWSEQRLCLSEDDGASWTVFDDPVANYRYFAWHPQDHQVVYVGTSSAGLRSDDAGGTWNPIAESIRAVFPDDGDTLYAVHAISPGLGQVLRSTDRGDTWNVVGADLPCTVNDVDVAPGDADALYVACNSGVFVYESGAWSQRGEAEGLERDFFGHLRFAAIAVDPLDVNVIYAGQRNWDGPGRGIFRSRDAGATWENINRNLPHDFNIWAISVSPHDGTVWVGTDHGNWRLNPEP